MSVSEVADNLIDLDDDVLGDFGLNGFAIDHLDKGDAYLYIKLSES